MGFSVITRHSWVLLAMAFFAGQAGAAIWYVDKDNTGGEDGLTWATAFDTIQEGVNAAYSAGGGEVWVGEGVYVSATNPVVSMAVGVHLYGGFVGIGAGGGETARDQRNWDSHVTTIDGQSARRCVIGANSATLDGFTVTRGNSSNGAGMYNSSASPTVSHCTFSNNAGTHGAAIYNSNSTANISYCSFLSNTVTLGGGAVANMSCSPTVSNCYFEGNHANSGAGALINEGMPGAALVQNCIFRGNSAIDAGALANNNAQGVTVNCVFIENTATFGGAVLNHWKQSSFINCTFTRNTASSGGAIYNNHGATTVVTNCILWGDTGGQEVIGGGTFTYSCILGGKTGTGNLNTDPLFVDAVNGDLHLSVGSPCADVGTLTAAPSGDIEGVPRPQGTGVDMGAYETPGATALLAAFSAQPRSGSTPFTVQFTDYSWPAGAPITSWLWTFGDGETSTIQNPSHVYTDPGVFTVSLTVTNANGTDLETKPNYILGSVEAATANFAASPVQGIAPLSVDFTDLSAPGTYSITDWAWDFGDGEGSNEQNPTHLYPNAGRYTVSLTVTTAAGPTTLTKEGYISTRWRMYVDVDNSGVEDGNSWSTAFNSIQEAADMLTAGGEIWVAEGTYTSTTDPVVSLPEGVELYGGFIGIGSGGFETELGQRDWRNHQVFIDGENLRQCLSQSSSGENTHVVDGIVARGRSGLSFSLSESASLLVANCIVRECNPGGGMSIMTMDAASALVKNCVFENCISDGDGGGAYLQADPPSTITVDSCIFRGNRALGNGGGLYLISEGTLLMANCMITNNEAVNGGGIYATSVNITNCTVAANRAWVLGGGVCFSQNGDGAGIGNSIIWGNNNVPIGLEPDALVNITYTDFEGGDYWGNLGEDPLFADPEHGDFRLLRGSPCIDAGIDTSGPGYGSVVEDFEGEPRAGDGDGQGAGGTGDGSDYDIGADECYLPTAPVVDVTPDSAIAADLLVCFVVSRSDVEDGRIEHYEFIWTCGIQRIAHGPFDLVVDALQDVVKVKGDTWTCAVRCWDGTGHSSTGIDSVTIGNTPPGPLTLSLPALESTSANLRCYLTKSPDPDGDVYYQPAWYVQRSGQGSYVPWEGPVINGDTFSQIDMADTLIGDHWRCEVTYGDGEDPDTTVSTDPCEIVNHGTTPSYISAALLPVTMTLGGTANLAGEIFPAGNPGASVFFRSTSPSGVESDAFPEAVIIAADHYTRTFYPIEASEGRTAWSLKAWWAGDITYLPAESEEVTLTVLKAQPEVLISLSHTSALLNLGNAEDFAVSVAFSVANWPSDPALQALLAGRTIRLSVMTPSGETPWAPLEQLTDADGVARFTAAGFASAGVLFDTAGTWKFKAEFPGDDNFRLAASEDFNSTQAKLTIKEGAGYAIVVLGRLDAAAEGHAEHAQTTDYAYSILRERGFTDDDIFYMREFLPDDIPNTIPVDGPPNAATLQYAIETWAAAEMTASPAPLYLVMVDHGNTGLFRLDDGSTGPQEYVASEEIAGWLDVLESSTDQPVFCIYGACYSGSFIPALSAPNRVVITSTAPGEISYRGVVNSDTGLRDGDFFLTELFRNAGEGRTIRNAFELACFKTYEYTASRSGDASSIPQHPMLDDNADGIGTTGLLSGSPGFDGAFVSGQDLGLGSNAGNGVTWFSVAPPITIESGVTVELWAETTGRPLLPGDQAWLEIKTPAYDDGEVATPGYDEFQRVAEMAGPIAPSATEDLGGGKYRFRWTEADLLAHEEFADGFDTQGTYKAYYFLRDAETGQVGTYLVTNIYKPKPDNDPPTPVTLLYPKNNAIVNPSLFLAWDESTDPNNDAFTYRVEVSESDTFPEGGTIVRDGLTDTTLRLGTAEGILNDHDYYWRVTAVDKWGAESAPNTVWLFRVRGNPGVLGAIRGKVTVKDMTLPVIGATITVIPASKQGTTSNTGSYFVGDLEQGVYNVNVTADGYKSGAVTGVFVESGDYTTLNVSLEPELINHAPVLTTFGNQTVWIGETFTGQLTATDIDTGTVLTFTSPDLPSGASLNPSSGVFVWSPTNADMGTHTITLTVTDNGLPPLIDTKTVVVTVKGGAEIAGPDMVEVGQPFQLMFYVPQKDANWVYEWRKDGTLLPAETGNIFARPSAALSDTGWYEATGWDQSEIPIQPLTARHQLTVGEDLPATGHPALALLCTALAAGYLALRGRRKRQRQPWTEGNTISGPSSVEEGERAELRVHIPSATGAWVYEWRKDGVLLPAVTGPTLVIESATFDDAGTYDVTAWNPNLLPITPISAQFSMDVTPPMPVSANTMLLLLSGVLLAAGTGLARRIWTIRWQDGGGCIPLPSSRD